VGSWSYRAWVWSTVGTAPGLRVLHFRICRKKFESHKKNNHPTKVVDFIPREELAAQWGRNTADHTFLERMNTNKTESSSVCCADFAEVGIQSFITPRSVVYPWHCDQMGHMNVMWYTGKFDEATWHLLNQIGITPSYLRDNKRGMVAVQQETTYKRELLAGDLITIRSGILEIREKVIRFHHEMLNAETDELAAATTLTGVHLDSEMRKSCPFPTDILERGRRFIAQANK